MSAEDPTEELNEILDLCRSHHLPGKAGDWAEKALVTAESILEKIEEMEGYGRCATTDQETALENIYTSACNWLRREPETDTYL